MLVVEERCGRRVVGLAAAHRGGRVDGRVAAHVATIAEEQVE